MNYVTSSEARRMLHISPATLMNWKNNGRIKFKKLSSHKFLYDIDSVDSSADESSSAFNSLNVIYARVSGSGHKQDLDNQIEVIKNYMLSNGVKPDFIFKDIASGMNDERKQLTEMLELVFKRKVKRVYITYKDRLTRFGFNYFKKIFSFFNTEIFILDEMEETSKTFQQEMCEDLISIIHTYSMKIYNSRRRKFKEIEKILSETSDGTSDEKEENEN